MKEPIKFSDWLRKIKKLSEEEIIELGYNPNKYIRVSRQYSKYVEENYS